MAYWNEKVETMSRDEMQNLQSNNLKKTVAHVYENVPYYKKKMDDIGICPGDIHSIEDLMLLPFTTKQDLRDNYPFGLFAVPMSDIVRIHASSGTTGKQTVVGYTKEDLDVWGEVMARSLTAAGVNKDSIVQVSYGYGLFTGGLGAHYGVETVGASVVPASSGNTKRQIQLIQDFHVTHIACTPSYALVIAEQIAEMGIDPESLDLQGGVFGAEPWTEDMRKAIESGLGLKAHDIYGLSEIMGPGVSIECDAQKGLHVNEDHFIPEIVDPDTFEVLKGGMQGELVFSTVTKQGLPLIRYRTKDISSLSYDTCDCGRTLVKMTKPRGRSDDMLIIRGVNVFPSQIESVLLQMNDVTPHYQIIVDRKNNLDTLEILVEMSQHLFSDEVKMIEIYENKIREAVKSTLGISAKIRLVEPKSITRFEGKSQRVIDKRNLY